MLGGNEVERMVMKGVDFGLLDGNIEGLPAAASCHRMPSSSEKS
jgi:hypothetical protein